MTSDFNAPPPVFEPASESPTRRPRWVIVLLVLLPAWLVVSGAGAMWYYFVHERKLERQSQALFARSVSVTRLEDDLRKIVTIIGERNTASPAAVSNLTRTASLIEGLLGPSNTGYAVTGHPGPADWPLLTVVLPGNQPESPAVWVLTSYDSRPGSAGAEANASGLAATLAAAQALANENLPADVHFLFLPHANDPDAPVIETSAKAARLTGPASSIKALLCVEAMGAGDALWLSSRETTARPLPLVEGLGEVYGVEVVCLGDDTDLASVLFEMNLPAVRVSTRPVVTADEPDNSLPSAATVAASAGRLIELIRRCAKDGH